MSEKELRKIILTSIFSIAVTMAAFMLRYGVNVLLAQHLPIDHYGDYAVMINVVFFTGTILLLGSDDAALRFIPEYLRQKEWGKVSGYIQHHTKLILIASVLVATAMFIVAVLLFSLEKLGISGFLRYHPALFAVWFAPMFAIILFQTKVLRSLYRIVWSILTFRIMPYTLMALGIFIFIYDDSVLSMSQALMVYGTALFIVMVLQFILILTALPHEVVFSKSIYLTREWLKVSTTIMFAGLIFAGMTTLDLLLLEILGTNDVQVGLFAAVLTICTSIIIIPAALNAIITPKVRNLVVENNKMYMQRFTNQCNFVVLLPMVLLSGLLIVFGKEILAHFGSSYLVGYPVLICIVIIFLIVSAATALARPLLQYSGYQNILLRINVVVLLLMLIIDIILIPYYGIYGVIIGMAVSRLVLLVMCIVAVRRKLSIKPFIFV